MESVLYRVALNSLASKEEPPELEVSVTVALTLLTGVYGGSPLVPDHF